MKSEFGRGYAICLLQFVFHEPRLGEDLAVYASLADRYTDWTPPHAVEMWANGSSDHLMDLIRPRSGITKVQWSKAKSLADLAIDAGHGWNRRYTEADARGWLATARDLLGPISTFDEAWEWDIAHGLKPQRGNSATCVAPMKLRSELDGIV